MAWWKKEKKSRAPRTEKLEIPPDAWEKCEACGHTDIREKFVRNLNVCPNCDYHRRIRAGDYVGILLDDGSAEETEAELKSTDPLGFPEYQQRLKKARATAGEGDAIMTATGTLAGAPVNVGVMDFSFMGGSMGSVVGEKIARLGQRSLERKYPLVLISASGGARMQEGVLSLMQMAKASAMLSQLAERRIPYVSILTNPTTGGVSASYAMLGDAILAEPGAGIDVVCVQPGAYPTEIFGKFEPGADADRELAYGASRELAPRIAGVLSASTSDPMEVANVLLDVIETAAGSRAARYPVGLRGPGVEAINSLCAQVQEQTLGAMGVAELTRFAKGGPS